MTDDREWCRAFIDHHCIFRSPPGELLVTSPDHGVNAWQFYLPIAVLDPEFMQRIARLFWAKYSPDGCQLCGCESGGSLLVSALQLHAGSPVSGFMIKKIAKTYGLRNWLERVVDPALPVLLVDDVVGSGKTLAEQAYRLNDFGLKIVGAFAIAACKLVKREIVFTRLGQEPVKIDMLYGPEDFSRLHGEYIRKYDREPKFLGTVI